jgi:sec-independent protein translocase protein TatC
MSAEMSISEHINELRSRTLHIVLSIIVITIFSMSFGIRTFELSSSLLFYYPYPDPLNNIAVQITSYMKDTLLPSQVKLIQTAPGQAFFSQIYISVLIGIVCSMPIIVKEIFGFISPAIDKQRRMKVGIVNVSIIPTISLFIFGIIFSYVLIIPFTLNFLYSYGQAIGVETFFNISDFISFVLQFLLAFGIAFELPVLMYTISLTGIIDARFWRNKFRYAVIVFVIFGAVITPDGSGITMWLVAGPMILLYLLGMIFIKRKEDDNKNKGIITTEEE